MTVKRKLVVVFIFLAGFIVTGISIARFRAFTQATEPNFTCEHLASAGTSELHSRTYAVLFLDTFVGVAILSMAELNISIRHFYFFSRRKSIPLQSPLARPWDLACAD